MRTEYEVWGNQHLFILNTSLISRNSTVVYIPLKDFIKLVDGQTSNPSAGLLIIRRMDKTGYYPLTTRGKITDWYWGTEKGVTNTEFRTKFRPKQKNCRSLLKLGNLSVHSISHSKNKPAKIWDFPMPLNLNILLQRAQSMVTIGRFEMVGEKVLADTKFFITKKKLNWVHY